MVWPLIQVVNADLAEFVGVFSVRLGGTNKPFYLVGLGEPGSIGVDDIFVVINAVAALQWNKGGEDVVGVVQIKRLFSIACVLKLGVLFGNKIIDDNSGLVWGLV